MNKKKRVATMLGLGAMVTTGGLMGVNPSAHADVKVPLTTGTQVTQSQEDQLSQLSAAQSAATVTSAAASSTAAANSQAALENSQAQTEKKSAATVASSAAADLRSAATDVNAASQELSAAQSVAANANSATLASASAAISDKMAAVSTAQSASSLAASRASAANSEAVSARAAVSAAQRDCEQKSAAYASAASAVAAAISGAENPALSSASAALSTANATLSAATAAYSAAQQAVSSASAAKISADDSLAAAQSAASVAATAAQSANDDLTAAQSSAAQAQSTASDANSSYQAAQQQTSAAQSAYDQISAGTASQSILNGNRIELSANFITAVKNLADYEAQHPNDTSSSTYQNLLNAVQATVPAVNRHTGRVEGYTYRSNPTDRQQAVDYQNLTLEQRIEISKFAGALVNDLRQQMGEQALKVSPESVKYAHDTVQQGYNDVNWQMFGNTIGQNRGHNSTYLEQHMRATGAAGDKENASMGLYQYQIDGVTGAVTRVLVYSGQLTMDDLKHTIYDDVVSMMLNDGSSQWGHTTNFVIPIRGASVNDTMGVDFDKYGASHYDFAGADSSNNFNRDAYDLSETPSGSSTALQSASTALSAAQAAEATASAAATSAATASSSANAQLSAAQQAASAARQSLQDTNDAVIAAQTAASQASATATQVNSTAADKLTALNTATSNQSAAAAVYQQAVDNQGTGNRTLQSAADQASMAASDARTALSAATSSAAVVQRQADQASSAASAAQADLVAAQNDLQTARNTYQQYRNAQANLTAAQDQLTAKRAILQAKQQAASQANARLASASAAADAAQDNANRASQAAASAAAANTAAQQQLAAARASVQSQAEMYGPSVQLKDITLHVGERVPALTIANPLSISVRPLASSLAMPMVFVLRSGSERLTAVPVGTTVAWSNFSRVSRDAAVAGTYHEEAILTFPDGSTTTAQVNLNVLSDQQQGGQQSGDHQQVDNGGTVQPQVPADNRGVQGNAGQTINQQGHPATGLTGTPAASVVETGLAHKLNSQSAVPSYDQQATRLPQTGSQQKNTLASVGVVLAGIVVSFAGLFGLKQRRH